MMPSRPLVSVVDVWLLCVVCGLFGTVAGLIFLAAAVQVVYGVSW